MKCPRCSFVFADSKDICQKCRADLRPVKKKIGLAVSYPDLPYAEVLKKELAGVSAGALTGASGAKKQKKKEKFSFAAFFGFLKKEKPRQERKEMQALPERQILPKPPAAVSPSSSSPPSFPPPPPPPPFSPPPPSPTTPPAAPQQHSPEILDLSSSENDLESTLDALLKDHEEIEFVSQTDSPTEMGEGAREILHKAEDDYFEEQGMEELIEVEFIEDNEDENASKDSTDESSADENSADENSADEFILFDETDLASEEEYEEEYIEEDESEQVWDLSEEMEKIEELPDELRWATSEESGKKEPEEEVQEIVLEDAPTLLPKPSQGAQAQDIQDISELFDLAFAHFQPSASEFALSIEHFHQTENREDIRLLFDMAFDSFEEPGAFPLQDSLPAPELRMETPELIAQARALAEQVDEEIIDGKTSVERILEQDDGFKIHAKSAMEEALAEPGPKALRLTSFLLDALLIIFLAFVFALFSHPLPADLTLSSLAQDAHLNLERLRTFLYWCIMLSFLYPFLSSVITSSTFGQWICGLRFRGEDGLPPSFSQKCILACTTPLSLLCGSPLLLALGQRSVHEILAGVGNFRVVPNE